MKISIFLSQNVEFFSNGFTQVLGNHRILIKVEKEYEILSKLYPHRQNPFPLTVNPFFTPRFDFVILKNN